VEEDSTSLGCIALDAASMETTRRWTPSHTEINMNRLFLSRKPKPSEQSFTSMAKFTRHLLVLSTVLFTWLGVSPAHAQVWSPSRPIRLIVPYGPGGSSDVIARSLAAEMSKGLGQQIVVDNKAGGQGVIAMQGTVRAAPDGYTIVLGHVGTLAVNPAMMNKLPYNAVKDFVPITLLAKV